MFSQSWPQDISHIVDKPFSPKQKLSIISIPYLNLSIENSLLCFLTIKMDTKKHVHHKDMKNQYESSSDDSIGSCLSSCSSDQMEDVSSSPSSSSSYGPLFELSDLMAQLPIKRGLSKYYHGKSKTFTSLASVESLEDLAKRERPNKRMKSCKNYGGGLDNHVFSPKATISKKKSSRISLLSTPKANRSRTVFDSLGIS